MLQIFSVLHRDITREMFLSHQTFYMLDPCKGNILIVLNAYDALFFFFLMDEHIIWKGDALVYQKPKMFIKPKQKYLV